jgi:hypothetical protein
MTINNEHNGFKIEIRFNGKLFGVRYEATLEEAFDCMMDFEKRGFDAFIC